MISVICSYWTLRFLPVLCGLVLILNQGPAFAQEEWIDFVVEKDSSMMSVSLDLRYYVQKPNYKNLMIVGSKFSPCMSNGFPTPESLDRLYSFSDSTAALVNRLTKNELVAILTYECSAFDVYYVKDTTGLREGLLQLIEKDFSEEQSYLTLKKDSSWEYYFVNLLPRGLTDDSLMDQGYLYDLVLQGDDLQGLRKVRHWLYFNNLKQRTRMSERLQSLNFSLDSIKYVRDRKWPYELQVSRMDSITPGSIYDLTTLMQILSAAYLGQYDGWGTELIKKED